MGITGETPEQTSEEHPPTADSPDVTTYPLPDSDTIGWGTLTAIMEGWLIPEDDSESEK